ncbi:dihydrodipicolinate synthase family protein [Loigolactobacillus binensis]|uniref:Dihydrodipicolinate synthase family protein n=1 Tax=Loigolactobacillus binensis TaxID=2559922 RepID=A0ABW3E7Q8_9LACO|nr:dihydrodipicolinate synthase family protein [Loigolactobacillus binensis]
MTLKTNFHVAVPTAFYPDETLNAAVTLDHIHRLQHLGINSVLVCGATGEQHSLTLAEKLALLQALDHDQELRAAPTFELFFGVASIRQKAAVTLMHQVNESHVVKGILLGFPPYILPTQAEAAHYIVQLCGLTTKPIIIDNDPQRTGFALDLAHLTLLIKNLPQICGLKTTGTAPLIQPLQKQFGRSLALYAAGELALNTALDYDHLFSIAGNLHPQACQHWFNDLVTKQVTATEQKQIAIYTRLLFQGSPLPFLKQQILRQSGLDMGSCRLPLGQH